MPLAEAERIDLRTLLATLTPEQWLAPSLCSEWRVRDVVAHIISYDSLSPAQLVGRMISAPLRRTSANAIGVDQAAHLTTDDLLVELDAHLTPTGITAGFRGGIGLTDGLIHQQDIRRPLGLARIVASERLVSALEFALTSPTLPAKRLVRGLELVATDLDWRSGAGPEVRGTGEALLMAIAGRSEAASELTGAGGRELAQRVGGSSPG